MAIAESLFLVDTAIARAAAFPRLRYMGSKYKLVPQLASLFHELGGRTAVDAFSGSGVVSYALKFRIELEGAARRVGLLS